MSLLKPTRDKLAGIVFVIIVLVSSPSFSQEYSIVPMGNSTGQSSGPGWAFLDGNYRYPYHLWTKRIDEGINFDLCGSATASTRQTFRCL